MHLPIILIASLCVLLATQTRSIPIDEVNHENADEKCYRRNSNDVDVVFVADAEDKTK